jgi:hypothetical protein
MRVGAKPTPAYRAVNRHLSATLWICGRREEAPPTTPQGQQQKKESTAAIVIAPAPAEGARRSGVDESIPQFGDGSRRRSATLLLQEYLNAKGDSCWGLVSDGITLRVMRDNISLTRSGWIEANLSEIFSEGLSRISPRFGC